MNNSICELLYFQTRFGNVDNGMGFYNQDFNYCCNETHDHVCLRLRKGNNIYDFQHLRHFCLFIHTLPAATIECPARRKNAILLEEQKQDNYFLSLSISKKHDTSFYYKT